MELVDERVVCHITQLVGPLPESDSRESLDDIMLLKYKDFGPYLT